MSQDTDSEFPPLPRPRKAAVFATAANTKSVRDGYEMGGYEKEPALFDEDQVRQAQRDAIKAVRESLLRAVKARDEEIERLRTQVRNLKESAATDGLHPSHKVAWADAIDVLRKRNDRLAAVIEKALKALVDIQKLPPEHGMAQNFARKTARELRLMLKEQQRWSRREHES